MTTGERMKSRRKAIGKSAEKVAAELGISPATVYRYEKGDIEKVPGEVIKALASILLTTPEYLMGWDEPEPTNSYPVGSFVRIPVIGRVLAGVGGLAEEEFLGYELAADVTAPEEHRYFLVKGDSMLPEIREGDRALVHIQEDVECGELAVVIVNGEEGLIKKVMKHDNAISLVSFNTNYPPRLFIGEEMNHIKIWGKVKKVERSY